MSDPLPPPPPSPLELLYFLRRVQVQQLATTDRWIKDAEQRQAALTARRPPPPPPDWVVSRSSSLNSWSLDRRTTRVPGPGWPGLTTAVRT
ncbi:hypothetical protein [Streptomyces sp. NBC_00467]|uniref:hypothetical protein n=1 Tax=Streptomyces sp. NBC_00467 TaxID=2975752 RepID=UPI002E19A0C0